MLRIIASLIAACVLTVFPQVAYPSDDGAHELEQLAQTSKNLPVQLRAEIVSQKYRFLFPPVALDGLDSIQLQTRFDAADIATFYSKDATIASEMRAIYDLLHAKGKARANDWMSLVGAQVISRNFDEIASIPLHEPMPEGLHVPPVFSKVVDEEADWQILRPGSDMLTRETYPITEGKHVVVISNPLCGFSDAASKAIESNRRMSAFFSSHGIWLVPPARQLYNNESIAWNESHPSQTMVLAYKSKNWPIIDDWSTPIFYFVDDGAVVEKIVGWPKDGSSLQPLLEAIDRFSRRR